ncbi:hypothetical protein EBR77_03855, partial [bacterium]|nr:hypothetical protein [bacterium]
MKNKIWYTLGVFFSLSYSMQGMEGFEPVEHEDPREMTERTGETQREGTEAEALQYNQARDAATQRSATQDPQRASRSSSAVSEDTTPTDTGFKITGLSFEEQLRQSRERVTGKTGVDMGTTQSKKPAPSLEAKLTDSINTALSAPEGLNQTVLENAIND